MSFDYSKIEKRLPPNWSLIKVGKIADINATTVRKNSMLYEIDYIDISSVSNGNMEPPKRILFSEAPSRAKRILKNGDILISTVRPNLRQHILLTDVGESWIASTGFCVISPKDLNSGWFIYAFLTSDLFTDYLIRVAEGAAYPAFNPKEIEEAIIPFPDKIELLRINNFIKHLYIKERINRHINQTLEEMARAIFKSWFVDFDPVRAKIAAKAAGRDPERAAMLAISGKTEEQVERLSAEQKKNLAEIAALFPDAMQDSELGEIPRGWEVANLGDKIKTVKGRSYKSTELLDSDTALVTLKSFARGGGYRPDGLKPYVGPYKPEQVVQPGELVVACTDVTQAAEVVGRPAIVRSNRHFKTLVASLDTLILRPIVQDVTHAFLYFLGGTERFKAHMYSHTTGTTVLHLAKNAVPLFQYVHPGKELVQMFDRIAAPNLNRIAAAATESDMLTELRDTLLPKLVSGEIELPDKAENDPAAETKSIPRGAGG